MAYIGKKLLKKGETGSNNIVVKYEGEALNVECCGSLTCGDIKGNVIAGGSINSKNIGGSVSCDGSITASSIGGSVSAGGGILISR